MIASTSRMCTNPPSVYELTIPKSHKITRIIATVQSKSISLSCRSVLGSELLLITCFPISPLARFYRVVDEFFRAIRCSLRLARHFLSLRNRFVNPLLRFLAQQPSRLFARLRSQQQPQNRSHSEPNRESRGNLRPILTTHGFLLPPFRRSACQCV